MRPSEIARRDRRPAAPNWSRLFASPIRLHDGTVLFTLKDAAQRILDVRPAPSSRVAAERIIEAALYGGNMDAARVAIRHALHSAREASAARNEVTGTSSAEQG